MFAQVMGGKMLLQKFDLVEHIVLFSELHQVYLT